MQTSEPAQNVKKPDFIQLYKRFNGLENGLKAALRRVGTPEDLRDTAAIYRLFHEARPNEQWLRVVFLFPWCEQCKEGMEINVKPFGALLADAEVNKSRLFQMARANDPTDLILLRRLAIQIKPTLDWNKFGPRLYYWNYENKRRIVEDFFYSSSKKTKKESV
ncbi:MAG: type I-E CRISPR-associated protein Cse2/CasB [Desulfatirhabdiaceae bacterium]